MPLSPGTRLGPSAVTATIGEGGMGVGRSTLVASCLVVLFLLASPTAAQVVPQSSTAAPDDAWPGRQRRSSVSGAHSPSRCPPAYVEDVGT